MSNVLDAEKQFELQALRNKIQSLEGENIKLRILLKEATGEDAPVESISDEEVICVQEIAKLRGVSNDRALNLEEVKQLDLLHKNLKIARGENKRVGRQSSFDSKSNADLEKLIKG